MKKSSMLAVLLAWLVPGAGHYYLGYRNRAALMCFVVVLIFLTGVLLSDGGVVSRERHPYAMILQLMNGAAAVIAVPFTRGSVEPMDTRLGDLAMLLTLVGGALNALLIADAFYRVSPDGGRNE